MKKQSGNGGPGAIGAILLIVFALGLLGECSRDKFNAECRAMKGVPAGNACVKPDSVIKKRNG